MLASCEVEAEQFVRFYNAEPRRGCTSCPWASSTRSSPRATAPRPAGPSGLDRGPDACCCSSGRLQALKGVDLALETLIELRARGRDAMLAIVGRTVGTRRSRDARPAARRVDEAGVIDHVSFVAPQAHQLLSTWMRAADVTLVPSRSESFGLVALESSACGTPVVASEVGGLMTLIEPGVNGLARRRARPRGLGGRRRGRDRPRARDVDVQRARSCSRAATPGARPRESLAALTEQLALSGLVRC